MSTDTAPVEEQQKLSVERVLVAQPHGYCAGVLFALRGVDFARQIYPDRPVWVYHEIVHNPDPVNELRALGVAFCDDLAEAPDGVVLLFSAHGVSPAVRAQAAARDFHAVIDLTCPLVARVHEAVLRHAEEQIVLIGKRTHDEIAGTMGEVPEHTHVVGSIDDVERLELPQDAPLVFVTQTTWSIQDAQAIIAAIRRRFPHARPAIATSAAGDANVHASICYATENRQQAVIAGAREAELVLVIGGDRSENTANLVHTARANGARSERIQDVSELRTEWLEGVKTVLITSGASTPEYRLEEVIAWFRARGVQRIEALGEPEKMQRSVPEGFALPPELRAAIRRAEAERGAPLQPLSRAAQAWRDTEL
ncbi:MAG TPA: 4-hydroxy-3-methylbut-2-enyl diphosphate reductase [Dehalococcoidia bacterium]|nr:4-hydroxy-3-methylbut-2-enyl diphosphate reductase [Dehalococcoidia bacterium]